MNAQKDGIEQKIAALRELYRRRGYTQFRMRQFEAYDFYARNKNFLVSENVITFTDLDGTLMALKPDVTLSIVKNTETAGVRRVYYHENVYRPTKSGTFGEIMQMGLECIGDLDEYCVFEVLDLAASSLAALSPDWLLNVSDLQLLGTALERAGVDDETGERLFACFGEKNAHELRALCGAAGVGEAQTQKLLSLLTLSQRPDAAVTALAALYGDAEWQAGVQNFAAVLSALPQERVRVDFSVVGNRRYYNGLIFQGFINGIPQSVLSGGRYDGLLARMGKSGRAVGFALYLDGIEAFFTPREDYDADVALLYPPHTPPQTVAAAAAQLGRNGETVVALTALPEKFTARRVVRLNENGVIVC